MRRKRLNKFFMHSLMTGVLSVSLATALMSQETDKVKPQLPDQTYMPVVIDKPFDEVMQADVAAKPEVMQKQENLYQQRYDMSDQPSDVKMSAGRKAVQEGVRVKLPEGVTWEQLSAAAPARIKATNMFPFGFRPLPHTKHPVGGQVFPKQQIDAIQKLENRDLSRFDVNFDLPDHLTPEFPPPIFLSSRPDLGDVSQGQVLSIKNYYKLLKGKLTPVQMEGMRLLLTPFPQQQFNQTEDRKVTEPSLVLQRLNDWSITPK